MTVAIQVIRFPVVRGAVLNQNLFFVQIGIILIGYMRSGDPAFRRALDGAVGVLLRAARGHDGNTAGEPAAPVGMPVGVGVRGVAREVGASFYEIRVGFPVDRLLPGEQVVVAVGAVARVRNNGIGRTEPDSFLRVHHNGFVGIRCVRTVQIDPDQIFQILSLTAVSDGWKFLRVVGCIEDECLPDLLEVGGAGGLLRTFSCLVQRGEKEGG